MMETLAALSLAGVGAVSMGALHPRVNLFGHSIWRGARSPPRVALTFDDGPHPEFTGRVVELLHRAGARGTFFCIGSEVERFPALARELSDAGHLIGNHTYRHNTGADLFSASRLAADLRLCEEVIAATTGQSPRFYRPAVGIRNPAVHAAARERGLTVVTWADSARDGSWPLTAARAERMGRRARAGDVLTLHDGTLEGKRALRECTVRHLPLLIDRLQQRGFELVTLDALFPEDPPVTSHPASPPLR